MNLTRVDVGNFEKICFKDGEVELAVAVVTTIKSEECINQLILNELQNIKEYDLCKDDSFSDEEIYQEYKENFMTYTDLRTQLNNYNINEILYIALIENKSNIKGLGRKLFNKITKEHNCIILDPLTDVIDYWQKVGFEDLDGEKMYLLKN